VFDSRRTFPAFRALWLTFAGCLLAAGAHAAKPPEVSHDGLQLVHDTKLQLVYIKPGVDFSIYRRIALLDSAVAFRKNWQRDQNRTDPFRVSKKDMDEIRAGLSALFDEIMRDELTRHGKVPLAEAADEDVLILRPAIVDLDVTAPAAADMGPGRSYTFATSAGEMTLYLELFDSATGEIVARVADREVAPDRGRMMWQNSVTNRADAERIIRRWAVMLREGLERVRTMPAPVVP
jgi:hypothetical protein